MIEILVLNTLVLQRHVTAVTRIAGYNNVAQELILNVSKFVFRNIILGCGQPKVKV
jgi:hypothetical protein